MRYQNHARRGRILAFLGVGFAFVLLSGCTHFGDQRIEDGSRYVDLEGESTKKDVFMEFGHPLDVRYEQDVSRWDYYSVETRPSAWNFVPILGIFLSGTVANIQHARFWFNEDDQLLNAETDQFSGYTNTWTGLGELVGDLSTNKAHERVAAEMNRYELTYDSENAKKLRDFAAFVD